jgi:hypothetical protein
LTAHFLLEPAVVYQLDQDAEEASKEETMSESSESKPSQISENRRARRRRNLPSAPSVVRQGDQHALAEHVAVEGHLPRYALDFAKKVNDMTGSDLKISAARRRSGARVRPNRRRVEGVLDGGHGVLVYHCDEQAALARYRVRPGLPMDLMLLAWHKYGGGKELLASSMRRSAERRVVPVCTDADPCSAGMKPVADRRLQRAQIRRRHFN